MSELEPLGARDEYVGWVGVGLVGGEVGALAFLLTASIWSWYQSLGFWYPLSLTGGTLLGQNAVSQAWDSRSVLVGLGIVIVLSALLGLLFTYFVARTSFSQGTIIAVAVGYALLLWVILIVILNKYVFPSGLSQAPRGLVVSGFVAWGLGLGLVTAVSLARSPRIVDRSAG